MQTGLREKAASESVGFDGACSSVGVGPASVGWLDWDSLLDASAVSSSEKP